MEKLSLICKNKTTAADVMIDKDIEAEHFNPCFSKLMKILKISGCSEESNVYQNHSFHVFEHCIVDPLVANALCPMIDFSMNGRHSFWEDETSLFIHSLNDHKKIDPSIRGECHLLLLK